MKFWACVLAMMVPGIVMANIASTTYTDKALSSKADDSAVVHNTGDETISGTKTFSDTIVGNSIHMGKAYTGDATLFMMGEYTELALESESSTVTATAGEDTAGIRMGTAHGDILIGTIQGVNNGNPSLAFTNTDKQASISFDSNFINLSQALKAPSATIDGILTIGNRIELAREVPSDFDNNTVPNTRWVNDRIEDARGVIPVGGADGTETAQIWIE